MPVFAIHTTILDEDFPATWCKETTSLIAKLLGKPEMYVVIRCHGGQVLTLGENVELQAIMRLSSIGKISEAENISYAKAITEYVEKTLEIPPARSICAKLKVFKASAETILLYGSESWCLNASLTQKLDGTYTKMLRAVYNVSLHDHITNKSLCGGLPAISDVVKRRRLVLAGHISRHDEPAVMMLMWTPQAKKRVGRPHVTVKTLLEKYTGLSGTQLLSAMENRTLWFENFVEVSPYTDG